MENYDNLSDKELKEIYEDMVADYWISYEKENETIYQEKISSFTSFWSW